MEKNNLNNFLVKFYCDDERILDINIEHWNEYVSALKVANIVTIKRKAYKVSSINMHHNTDNGRLVIELYVILNEVTVE
ncbi:hypothetical protein [Pseudalkalibacillus sp. JSM 102089]|uniref:hypothetical protein n=1 Tax=Pseudalkalibacillus sp. JSM 102089 TaxID=3229856 RepID=UPI0035238F3A